MLRDAVRWVAERPDTHHLVVATRQLSEQERSDLESAAARPAYSYAFRRTSALAFNARAIACAVSGLGSLLPLKMPLRCAGDTHALFPIVRNDGSPAS